MKLPSATIVIVALLGLLAYTNPKMADYEQFIHNRIIQDTAKHDGFSKTLGLVFGGFASSLIANATKRSDYVFLSVYDTDLGNNGIKAVGALNNFFVLTQPSSDYAKNDPRKSSSGTARLAVPPFTAWVTDLTSTLSLNERAVLEQKLASFESGNGAQIAVLIVPTTQPETIDQYATRVSNVWKLGRKGVDDGVLLLVAKNDRRLRIEVGSGLEVVLNNATAKRILDEIIAPKFRSGDFFGGISGGVATIIAQLESKDVASPN